MARTRTIKGMYPHSILLGNDNIVIAVGNKKGIINNNPKNC
jgi:hypothetical protein